jgi:hypothetical protein
VHARPDQVRFTRFRGDDYSSVRMDGWARREWLVGWKLPVIFSDVTDYTIRAASLINQSVRCGHSSSTPTWPQRSHDRLLDRNSTAACKLTFLLGEGSNVVCVCVFLEEI